jgi:hypothetical protein
MPPMDACTTPAQRWWHHGLIVLALWGVAIARYWKWIVLSPSGLADSSAYFQGFSAVLEGRVPYVHPRFLYPPLFAHGGAWLTQHLGLTGVAVLLQLINLLAASALVWISLTLVVPRLGVRLVAAPVLLALLPPILDSIGSGNIAIAITCLALAAALLWGRAPFVAGGLLGLALAAKPMAVGFLPVLALQRTFPGPRCWGAIGMAVAIAAGSLALYPTEALAMFHHLGGSTGVRTVSLHAALRELGLLVPAAGVTVLVGAAGGLVAYRARGLHPISLAYLSCALSLAMLPVISNGSLSLGLPIIFAAPVFAARRLARQWNNGQEQRKKAAIRDLLFVIIGVVVFCAGNSWTLWPEAPQGLSGVTMTFPLLSLGGLTWFCLTAQRARAQALRVD